MGDETALQTFVIAVFKTFMISIDETFDCQLQDFCDFQVQDGGKAEAWEAKGPR